MKPRTEWTLQIAGMTCDHCAKTIDAALRHVPGVVGSQTDYAAGRAHAIVEGDVDGAALSDAVGAKGYRVTGTTTRAAEGAKDGDAIDVLIIGAGSAGVAAAIRAAELGASVTIVEEGTLGGTCVNVGCVPSKTMLRAAEVAHRAARHPFAGVGTRLERIALDEIVRQKNDLVSQLRQAKYANVLAALPSVKLVRGRAKFLPDGSVAVAGEIVRARRVVLATGSSPWAPPIPGLEGTRHLTSTDALALDELPRSMIVVGGSAVGLEIAQMFSRFGTRVTVLEAAPRLVPAEDSEVGAALSTHLREEEITVHTGVTILGVQGQPGSYHVEARVGEARLAVDGEQLLVATGRRANTAGLALADVGIALGEKRQVLLNEYLETSRKGVYAAGDVAGDPMFVYVAARAGRIAVENALRGNEIVLDLSVVPRVTFTDPAVASVGLTEAQARERGVDAIASLLALTHVPRALAARDTRGFVKLVADRTSNLLVGAHILAHEAGEMVQAAAMAIEFGIRVDQIAAMLHPYLTHAEAIKLACQAFQKDVATLSCCAA